MTANRRVVVPSNFWRGSAADGVTHGLRKLGWDICYVEMQSHFLQSRSLAMRMVSRVLRRLSVSSYNNAILDAVDELRPRAFLAVKGSYLEPATLEAIRRRGVMTLLYYTDFHFDQADLDQDTFVLYDRFFTNNSLQIPYLKEKLGPERVALLHFGYSPDMHYPRVERVGEKDFVADCGYVGTCTPYKVRWLEAIAQGCPDVKLAIVGNGWSAATRGTPLAASVLGHQLVGDAYCRFLQQVRINLAFHMGPLGRNNWQDLVSMRTFEIPACKGFMLHIDNEEVRGLFKPGEEIDVFATPEDLCGRIRYYLSRPELRAEMVARAYARCVPAYSYDTRAAVIGRAIEGMTSTR